MARTERNIMTMTRISKAAAAAVTASFPLMHSRRDALERAMCRHMSRRHPPDHARERDAVAARAIMDMLLDHAARVSDAGTILRIERHDARHRRLAIRAEDHSRFGDGLAPIMRDVLGAEATRPVLAAWGDAYWAISRLVRVAPPALAA
jgi:nitric oxide dioxygenase